jgi:hypothetical protein
MVLEVEDGQASGELATYKDGTAIRDLVRGADQVAPVTYKDLGIDKRRVREWRILASVPIEVLEEAACLALLDGRAPTHAQRLGFAPEEGVNIFDALIEEERGLARRRLSEAGKRGGVESGRSRRGEREEANPPGISRRVQDQEARGESRELAANVTGYSEKSLRMARFVVSHAVAEPDTFDEIRTEMNRSRNIGKAHAAVRRIERERAMAKQRQPGSGAEDVGQYRTG